MANSRYLTYIWTLCVNVWRFETVSSLWRPQDLVQVISASPSFRRFLQRPEKITSHIDLMEFLDWRTFWNTTNFGKKTWVSVPLFLLCLAPDHRRQGETRFRGMSRQLQPEEHPPASGLHKAGPFKKKPVSRAHPQKKKQNILMLLVKSYKSCKPRLYSLSYKRIYRFLYLLCPYKNGGIQLPPLQPRLQKLSISRIQAFKCSLAGDPTNAIIFGLIFDFECENWILYDLITFAKMMNISDKDMNSSQWIIVSPYPYLNKI